MKTRSIILMATIITLAKGFGADKPREVNHMAETAKQVKGMFVADEVKQKIVENPDGTSVFVIDPRFKDEDGNTFPFSGVQPAEPNKICKNLGFLEATSPTDFILEDNVADELVTVDPTTGFFNGLEEPKAMNKAFKWVACKRHVKDYKLSTFDETNYERLIRDPNTGRVTIVNPNFGKYEGKLIGLNTVDGNQVCSAFGYGKMIDIIKYATIVSTPPAEGQPKGQSNFTTIMAATTTTAGTIIQSTFNPKTTNTTQKIIKYLTCEPSPDQDKKKKK